MIIDNAIICYDITDNYVSQEKFHTPDNLPSVHPRSFDRYLVFY